jgi:hypothetical protein
MSRQPILPQRQEAPPRAPPYQWRPSWPPARSPPTPSALGRKRPGAQDPLQGSQRGRGAAEHTLILQKGPGKKLGKKCNNYSGERFFLLSGMKSPILVMRERAVGVNPSPNLPRTLNWGADVTQGRSPQTAHSESREAAAL